MQPLFSSPPEFPKTLTRTTYRRGSQTRRDRSRPIVAVLRLPRLASPQSCIRDAGALSRVQKSNNSQHRPNAGSQSWLNIDDETCVAWDVSERAGRLRKLFPTSHPPTHPSSRASPLSSLASMLLSGPLTMLRSTLERYSSSRALLVWRMP